LPEDRDAVAIWQLAERERCSDCGTAEWEWEENPDAWHADHVTCEGCRRLAVHGRSVMDGPGKHDGVKLALYRTPREG
jgi:hypothetical protein